MALVVTGIVSKLAQFSGHMIGPILSRYHQNPQHLFSDLLMIYSVYSARLKYIPYSNKIRITFASCDKNEHSFNKLMHDHYYLTKNENRILDPHSPEVARVMRVLTKIVQALNDGLRLRHDCRVSSANRVGCENRNEEIIVSKYGKDERRAPPEQSIEHLDGMNWEVAVVESDKFRATYHGNGKIVMHTEMLNSFDSDANLAFTLGHEVGHGVAMHMEGYSLDAVLPFAIIPWASSFWGPAIVLRLCDLVLYVCRRNELEADYIGLMLMASAGYDPRFAPYFYKDLEYHDKYRLDTTHPSFGRRAQMLSRHMDKAFKIYEQIRAGHGVPSFIEKGKKIIWSRDFNPFSVTI